MRDVMQGNTFEQRQAVRRAAANWVRQQIFLQRDDAKAELTELLDMLGLLPTQEEKLTYRVKLRDCGPVMVHRKAGNRHRR